MIIILLQLKLAALMLGFSLLAEPVSCRVHCGRGEMYVPGAEKAQRPCKPCEPGFFQEKRHHRHRYCERCQIFDEYDPREVLVRPCTRIHDIKIGCVPGFYWSLGDCNVCTDCSLLGKVEAEPCHENQDTVCRERRDAEEKNRVDVRLVSERKCGRGFYFDGGKCRLCTNCDLIGRLEAMPCQEYGDAICEEPKAFEDYIKYRDVTMNCARGFYRAAVNCFECTNCASIGKFQARPCRKRKDTVCCESDNMVVRHGRCLKKV